MKTSQINKDTLVTFHTGRGGHFNNGGHRKYVGCGKTITDSQYVNDLFIGYENWQYVAILTDGRDLPNIQELIERVFCNVENPNADDNARLEKIAGRKLGPVCWVDHNGYPMVELDAVTGRLDFDGDYNTIDVMDIADCDEAEIELIVKSNEYKTEEIEAYISENYGYLLPDEY